MAKCVECVYSGITCEDNPRGISRIVKYNPDKKGPTSIFTAKPVSECEVKQEHANPRSSIGDAC